MPASTPSPAPPAPTSPADPDAEATTDSAQTASAGPDDTRSATEGEPAAQGDVGGTAGTTTERPAPQGDTEHSDDAGDTVDAGDAVDVRDADDTGDAGGTRSTTAASPAAQDPAGEVVAAETSGAPRGRGAGARLARLRAWRERYPRAARVVWWATTVLSVVLLYLALLLPVPLTGFEPRMLLRLPGEAVVVAAVLTALPRRPRVVVAALGGAGLAALTVVNLLDMGFGSYLGRGFNLVLDWELLDDARSYLADSLGGTTTALLTAGVLVLVVALFAGMAAAMVRVGTVLGRDAQKSTRVTLVAGTVWITCSVLTVQLAGQPLTVHRAAGALNAQTDRVRDTLRDEAAFGKEARADRFGNTPAAQLVPDLRGKDVVFTFIESYGRSAIEDPVMAPGVDRTLASSTAALEKAGYRAKSGWLTSATYGGSSWLGHSTTLSGLWIDNQQRYRTVMASDHLSLTKAFQKTGAWDTVGVMPGVQKGWPEQKYYGLDKVYNAFQLGYQGPKFSWSTMPDQYALEAYQRLVHGKQRDKPLMSEIILTSSHQPWAPIPKMVGWDELGDGSVFGPIEKAGRRAGDVIADTTASREEYGKSIQYSVTALTQWLERYGTDDTVLVFLGDHQPISRVSGTHASRDVPISIVAKDPKVLDRIADWGWTDGLRPAHGAPVWKMSAFRDRFLLAYGSTPHPSGG
ncbi:CDP-alcohol phosphatidyltransferase [Streptomyces longwoodensis]|uniref:CDP-alcohol phosphatidyltransferase n=1 Tax=Streptomyces longwoodensis TaxID=68231 RepID=UPI003691DEE9